MDADKEKIHDEILEQRDLWDATRKNIEETLAMLKTADRGLYEISLILERLRELAAQGAGFLSYEERLGIEQEALALIEEIDLIAGETQHRGRALLNGRTDIRF
ncbi:MAG: hypothetical protein LBT26_12255 [Clostridiales Family XIII bacterium]|nr:hypothetical protein [Clostridiales Family XIII bacterium]